MANKNLFLQSPSAGDISEIYEDGASALAASVPVNVAATGLQPEKPAAPQAPSSTRPAAAGISGRGAPSVADLERRATELGVDPALARSFFTQESSGNWDSRDSGKGAVGGMQVMPGTYKAMMGTNVGQRDPWQNMEAGLRYIAYGQKTLNTKDPALLAAGYHAGYDRKDLKAGIIPQNIGDGHIKTSDYAASVARRVGQGGGAQATSNPDPSRYTALTPEEMQAEQRTQVQAKLEEQEPGRYSALTDDELGKLPASASVPPTVDDGSAKTGFWERLPQVAKNGWDNMTGSLDVSRAVLSNDFSPQTVKLLATNIQSQIGRAQKDQGRQHASERELKQAIEDFGKTEGWGDSTKGLFSLLGTAAMNPKGVAIGTVEQVANMLPSIGGAVGGAATGAGAGAAVGSIVPGAGTAAGAAAGALWGSRAGLAAGTAALEFGNEITQAVTDRLQKAKLPITEENIVGLLSNPEVQAEVKAQAAKKGLTLAAVDALSMGLAGKVGAKGVQAAASGAKGRAAAYGAGAVGVELAGEPAGEAISQLVARGEIDKADVAAEAIYGAGSSVAGAGMGTAGQVVRDRVAGAPAPVQQPPAARQEPAMDVTYTDANGNTVTENVPGSVATTAEAAADTTPTAQPAPVTPSGPIGRALEKGAPAQAEAAAEEVDLPRVRVVDAEGKTLLTGFAENIAADGTGRVLSDDGQVHQITAADGVAIVPETTENKPQADGASASEAIKNEAATDEQKSEIVAVRPVADTVSAQDQAQTQASPAVAATETVAKPEPAAAPEVAAAPVAEASQEAQPKTELKQDVKASSATENVAQPERAPAKPDRDLTDYSDTELTGRLEYIANQAKFNGGMTGPLVKEKGRVQREINRRTKDAPSDANAAANAVPDANVAPAGQANTGQPDAALKPTNSTQRATSWMVLDKQTGKVVLETSDKAKIDALNTDKYEAFPAQHYLGGFNRAVKAAGGSQPESQQVLQAARAVAAENPLAPERDAHAGKWFSTQEKAEAYVSKRDVGASHEVVQTGKVRFEVKPKVSNGRRTASIEKSPDGVIALKRTEKNGMAIGVVYFDSMAEAESERIIWESGSKLTDKPLPSQESDIDAAATAGFKAGEKGNQTPPSDLNTDEEMAAWRIGNRRGLEAAAANAEVSKKNALQTEATAAADLDAMFDDAVAAKKEADAQAAPVASASKQAKAKKLRAAKPAKTEAAQAAESLTSAAKNTAAGLTSAIDGLGALFGGSGKFNSGLTFDEETYAKAKPLFKQAISHLGDAGKDLRAAMQAIVNMVMDKFGEDATQRMKPYVVRFVQDVRDGNEALAHDAPAVAATENVAESARVRAADRVAALRKQLPAPKKGQPGLVMEPAVAPNGADAIRFHVADAKGEKIGKTQLMRADVPEAEQVTLMQRLLDDTLAQSAKFNQPKPTDVVRAPGANNATSASDSVERHSGQPAAGPVLARGDADTSGAVRPGDSTGGRASGEADAGQQGDPGVPADRAPAQGDASLVGVHRGDGAAEFASVAAGSDFRERGSDAGDAGVPADARATEAARAAADSPAKQRERKQAQRAADSVKSAPGIENIRATLPALLPGQQDDVAKVETRFAKPDGYGMLLTNGTGTGKTYSGLGVAKRFDRDGKGSILVVVPDDKVASDWAASAGDLGLNATQLADTKSAGTGMVVTTYAALGQNNALASRQWDLVIADESHKLMQGADGRATAALDNLRAITQHPDGAYTRYQMQNAGDIATLQSLIAQQQANEKPDAKLADRIDALEAKLTEARKAAQAEVQDSQGAKRPRALFLSATPFAYEKTVDWANGYLFQYPQSEGTGYNSGNGQQRFMMQHFGYTMRYNKLTEPDAKVDRGLMQRNFNTWLKREGVLSGRALDVQADYDRRFVLIDSKVGNRIDEAFSWLDGQRRETAGDDARAWHALSDGLHDAFDYLSRRYLLEAIKAKESIPYVKGQLALGRKVVVFHDYKQGGGFNPFASFARAEAPATLSDSERARFVEHMGQFRKEFADLVQADWAELGSATATYREALGDQVMVVNGDEKAKDNLARYKRFQDDTSGPQVILVQSAKNAGWSGHDTTGKHQRVLLNLGLPTAPTMAIQQEGRIYRTGQASDAIMRYMNTGTSWEKQAFAATIAGRASTTENLGQGEEARALKDSFIAAFEESDAYAPGHEGEGKGGKERDRAANAALTEYDRAKAYYWATQKKNAKTKAQEGKDYFATPEPLGQKMVAWADARGGDKVLEPSAGHGAIARWFGDNVERTVVEPSSALRARLALVIDPANDRVVAANFEDLAISNKYDAIAMNPPFGTGGKLAVEHLAKAAQHLRDGGRVVAILPAGPSADKHFDKWLYAQDDNGQSVHGNLHLVAEVKLPQSAFERAGTTVAARVVVIDKSTTGAPSMQRVDLSDAADINVFFDRLEGVDLKPRQVAEAAPAAVTAVAPAADSAESKHAKTTTFQPGDVRVTHTTGKGKTLTGIVRKGISQEQAKALDPYTMKKDGGWFIRDRHVDDAPRYSLGEDIDRDQVVPTASASLFSVGPEALFDTAAKWMSENLQGTSVRNPSLRADVHFSRASRKAISVGRRDAARMSAVQAMSELVRNGVLVDEAADSKGRESVDGYATLVAPVSIDGTTYAARMKVRRAGGRNVFYNIEGFDLDKTNAGGVGPLTPTGDAHSSSALASDGGAAAVNKPGAATAPSTAETTVGQLLDAINGGRRAFSASPTQKILNTSRVAAKAINQNGLKSILENGPLGDVVARLIAQGKVVLHDTASSLPGNAAPVGVQGVTASDGTIHLVGKNLTADNATGVLLHEAFHSGGERLIGGKAWAKLEGRLEAIRTQAAQSSGGARAFYDKARASVARGQRAGVIPEHLTAEEFGAYTIEHYDQAPAAFRKLVDDVLGAIKAWLLQRFGAQLGDVTPAQLRAIAVAALRDAGQGQGARYSVGDVTSTPAFKRWFGDSKVVDAEGKPLVVYHGTGGDVVAFDVEMAESSRSAEVTGVPGFYFTPIADVAGDYAFGKDGANVIPAYLATSNPKTVAYAELIGGTFDRATLEASGHDGMTVMRGGKAWAYVAFQPAQIKSAIGNNGDFDPDSPDIRYSLSTEQSDKAVDAAIDSLTNAPRNERIGRVVGDIGLGARLFVHPRSIAAIHKRFTPVYNTAISQVETRDKHIAELGRDVERYNRLSTEGKANVNKLLELGRLTSQAFTDEQLNDGVVNTGFKQTVRIGASGKPKVVKQPIYAQLSEAGEVVQLSEAEQQAYRDLRKMFDNALDKFRDQALADFGFAELVGDKEASKTIAAKIKASTKPADKERLQNVASFMREIEQGKRTGYVPFARYGDYYVTVKEKTVDLEFTKDGDDAYAVRNVPADWEADMLELGALPEGDTWMVPAKQRGNVAKMAHQTVYSTKVETGLEDMLAIRKAEKAGAPVESIPAVKAAIDKARKEWVDGHPNRSLSADAVREKTPDAQVKLTDVDALAEVANIDNPTWDAVRDKLATAIQGKSFRKHFFHSDNVPGYTPDFERAVADYVIGMSGYLSRRAHQQQWDNNVTAIKDQPKLFEYASKYREYVNNPQEEFAAIRQAGFFAYIAGVTATAFANLTQVPLLTVPTLSQIAPPPLVMKELATAYKDAFAMLTTKKGMDLFDPKKAPADVRAAVLEAWDEGAFVPLESFDMMMTARQRNVGRRKLVKGFNDTTKVVAIAFTFAERLNRLVTFMAAARLATKQGVQANINTRLSKNELAKATIMGSNLTPKSFAEWAVDESQYRMGKANRPTTMRGVGAAVMQFKGFMLQTFEVWYRMASMHGPEGKYAAAASLLALYAMAGLWGMPGADDLRGLIEAAYKQITDKDLDLKTELRAWVARTSGSNTIAQIVNKGASYPLGVDLTRVGMGNIAPDSALQAAGIPFDLLVGRPTRAFGKASTGDALGAAGELAPNVLKHVLVSGSWALDGVRDKSGQRILSPDHLSTSDLAMKAAGFQPSIVTDVRDYSYAQYRQERAVDGLKRKFAAGMARNFVEQERAEAAGDTKKLAALTTELEELYTKLEAHNADASPEERIQLTRRTIQQRMVRERGGLMGKFGSERKQAREGADELRGLFGLREEVANSGD